MANIQRCFWCDGSDLYNHYHDTEWGYPVQDDQRLFEKISLEGFQAGLSWLTILKKRESFREAFCHFKPEKIAHWGEPDIQRLLANAGIVRHRGKIEAVINNAQRALELQSEFGSLAAFFWRFEVDISQRPAEISASYLRTVTQAPESIELSKILKKRGWKFVGPTTVYAFMQAMGLVNDHQSDCDIREKILEARAKFTPPKT